ncbi:lipase family protein [Methylosinus sp. KRF6]|nr:lipase family protein [Methylosinus sp. KRF6]
MLKRSGFDLDTAVFLAEASAAAYSEAGARAFAKENGFSQIELFDRGNVQGYWCGANDSALLVFRGTNNIGQWLRDFQALPAPHEWGWVHLGFSRGVDAVARDLRPFDESAGKAGRHIWIAGHSLGGALAVLAAARLRVKNICAPLVLTYGQPAVGLADFASRFDAELSRSLWHVVNQNDVVPRVPPLYSHCGVVKRIIRPGALEAVAEDDGAAQLERPVVPPSTFGRSETLQEIIGVTMPATLETATPERVEISDVGPSSLSNFEFARLQVALGAGESAGMEGVFLEGAMPFFKDHHIGAYIQLLKDIRDSRA